MPNIYHIHVDDNDDGMSLIQIRNENYWMLFVYNQFILEVVFLAVFCIFIDKQIELM